MSERRSRIVYATLLAVVSATATALIVLLAYLLADFYLASKGLLTAAPAQELAHVRIRDLLLIVGMPLMGAAAFAAGWFSHSASEPATVSRDDAASGSAPAATRSATAPAATDRTDPPAH